MAHVGGRTPGILGEGVKLVEDRVMFGALTEVAHPMRCAPKDAGVSGLAEALAEGGYLMTVAAGSHAAPAALMGFGAVVEPEDA